MSPSLEIQGQSFQQSRDQRSHDSLRSEFSRFLTKKVLPRGRQLQSLLCEKYVRTNHLTRTHITTNLPKCNFCHSSHCSWGNYCAFIKYGLGQLLLCTIYVNIKCLPFNFSCHLVFPCRTIQC